MTITEELITLRDVLALRRRGLIDRLATDESSALEQAHVAMLADTHTAIAAVDGALAEFVTGGAS